jgi:ADP-heptose:LPS heptosyltransferase
LKSDSERAAHSVLDARSRILIVRLRSLGDCVLSTPALQLLKRHLPEAQIAVVVEDQWRAVYEGNPDIAAILPPLLKPVREFHPDVSIDLHGGNTATRLTAFSGARYRAGFAHYRYRAAYNIRIPRAQEILGIERKVHTAEHVASAMFYLGVPRQEIPRARLFLTTASRRSAPYAVIHPVAATAEKTWPAAGFLQLARFLKEQRELEVVFVAAAGDDLSAFRDWEVVSGAPLAELKSLIAGATLFAGNDSGPAHIAAAFGIPSVVLFGPSDPAIWGPWSAPGEAVQATPIDRIDPTEVMNALGRLRAIAA